MSPIKCYCMLQYAKVRAFTVSELLRKTNRWLKLPLPPPRLGLKGVSAITHGWICQFYWKVDEYLAQIYLVVFLLFVF